MKCPRCKTELKGRAYNYGECADTNSVESTDEIYEDYYCTCPSCGVMFTARETFVFARCEVRETNRLGNETDRNKQKEE